MHNVQRLFLLRHAEAEAASFDISDFDRPLSARGKIDAAKIGKIIKNNYDKPQKILVSPSKRTKQTVTLLHLLKSQDLNIIDKLYNGNLEDYLKILNSIEDASSVLLIGHNPAVFMLFQFLVSPKSKINIPQFYPPAGLAIIDLDNKSKDLTQHSSTLIAFHNP